MANSLRKIIFQRSAFASHRHARALAAGLPLNLRSRLHYHWRIAGVSFPQPKISFFFFSLNRIYLLREKTSWALMADKNKFACLYVRANHAYLCVCVCVCACARTCMCTCVFVMGYPLTRVSIICASILHACAYFVSGACVCVHVCVHACMRVLKHRLL